MRGAININTVDIGTIVAGLRESIFGDKVDLIPEGANRYRVNAPIVLEDGDHPVIILRQENAKWVLSDEGHTLLRYGERAWQNIVNDEPPTGVKKQGGELVLTITGNRFGRALYVFARVLVEADATVSLWDKDYQRKIQQNKMGGRAALHDKKAPSLRRLIEQQKASLIDVQVILVRHSNKDVSRKEVVNLEDKIQQLGGVPREPYWLSDGTPVVVASVPISAISAIETDNAVYRIELTSFFQTQPAPKSTEGLNALAQGIHENAVAHGWWETNPEFPEIAALCHSELSEALTEYRNGKPMLCCVDGKPEGIAIELADCIIRILDYCARRRIDIDEALSVRQSVTDDFGALPELIAECHYRLSMAYKEVEPRSLYLAETISLIKYWCASNDVVIEEVIRVKHEYNKARPYRHGGKII